MSSRLGRQFRIVTVYGRLLRSRRPLAARHSTVRDPAESLRTFYGEDIRLNREGPSHTIKHDQGEAPRTELTIESIRRCIEDDCEAQVTIYQSEYIKSRFQTPAIMILSLETTRERISLAEGLLKKFRPLLGDGEISIEGIDGKDADWIVIDLEVATVHIFDAQARLEYGVDEKYAAEGKPSDVEEHIQELAQSMPRKIAGDPSRPDSTSEAGIRTNPFL